MSHSKPILCLDFDGVIHSYEKGWQDGQIYGTVTEGFFAWAEQAVRSFSLAICSSRQNLNAMRHWLNEQLVTAQMQGLYRTLTLADFTFSTVKPPAFLTIDDRALTFTGSWADFDILRLKAFKPWSQRTENDRPPAEPLVLYDINTDRMRPVTQQDVNKMLNLIDRFYLLMRDMSQYSAGRPPEEHP